MKHTNYSKIVKYSAIYDVLMTFPFALPGLTMLSIGFYTSIHNQIGLSGAIPEFLPMHLFFVNLLGCLVLVWSAIRIYRPLPLFGLFDSFARFLFSFTMCFYLINHNATGLLWFLLVPEFTWGLVQVYGYFLVNKSVQRQVMPVSV